MESALRLSAGQPSFTAGSVIGRTFSVWSSNIIPFSAVFLTFHLPSVFMALIAGPAPVGEAPAPGFIALSLANALLSGVLSFAATGALCYGVLQSFGGTPRGAGTLIGFGLRKIWPTLVVSLDAAIRILLWSLLLIVPGLVAICRYFVAVPAKVAEPALRSHEAVGRSVGLTREHLWSIFVVMVVFWAAAAAVGALVGVLGLRAGIVPFSVATTASWLLDGVISSLWAAAAGVAYHDLRIEKEGVDTAQLAAIFA